MSANRRNKISGQFASRLIEMLESPAYRALSQAGHGALSRVEVELAHHGGQDNGKLAITFEDFVRYGMPRSTIGPALAENEALGFFKITVHGKPARAAEYRRPNLFLLTTRPELEGVGTERCGWRRFKTLQEAQGVADAARKRAVAARKSPGHGSRHGYLIVAGSDLGPITVQIPNQCHASNGSDSEPLRTSESEPLSKSRVGDTNGDVTGVVAEVLAEATGFEAEIRLSEPRADPAVKISHPARLHCEACETEIQSRRIDARFCSPACRKRAQRRRDEPDARKLAWSKPEVGELCGDKKRDRAKLYAASAERRPA